MSFKCVCLADCDIDVVVTWIGDAERDKYTLTISHNGTSVGVASDTLVLNWSKGDFSMETKYLSGFIAERAANRWEKNGWDDCEHYWFEASKILYKMCDVLK